MKTALILKLIGELYTATVRDILVEKAASTDTRFDDLALDLLDKLLGVGDK